MTLAVQTRLLYICLIYGVNLALAITEGTKKQSLLTSAIILLIYCTIQKASEMPLRDFLINETYPLPRNGA